MKSQSILIDVATQAQDVLWETIVSGLPDELALDHLRTLVHAPDARKALKACSDNSLSFALRSLQCVVSDVGLSDREKIERLWPLLEDSALNAALGRRAGVVSVIGRAGQR